MSDATRIRPRATRATLCAAIEAAEKMTTAAALTEDPQLTKLAVQLQREAWRALNDHDARAPRSDCDRNGHLMRGAFPAPGVCQICGYKD